MAIGVVYLATTSPLNAQSLTVEIDLDANAIEFEKIAVTFTNHTMQPIRIWNPRTRQGYRQLSFEFVEMESEVIRHIRNAVIDDDDYWDKVHRKLEPGSEIIEVPADDQFTLRVNFSSLDHQRNGHKWKELPVPNTGQKFKITVKFAVDREAPDGNEIDIWHGSIKSEPVTAEFRSSRMSTPHEYLRYRFPDRALEIMKRDPEWILKRDGNQKTPLHIATRFAQIEVVKWLLDNGAEFDAKDNHELTPLHISSDVEVVKLLLDHGADVDAKAYNNLTPLHMTSDVEIIELSLAKGPDLSAQSVFDNTPLQKSCEKIAHASSPESATHWRTIVQMYLDTGAKLDLKSAIRLNDLDRIKDIISGQPRLAHRFQSTTPLRLAAKLGHLGICQYLIEEHKADVNDSKSHFGHPIIKDAFGHPEIVSLLIQNGADLKIRIPASGYRATFIGGNATALHFAAARGVPESVTQLIDKGVDIFALSDDSFYEVTENSTRRTAIEVAAYFGKAGNLIAILNHPEFDKSDEKLRQAILNECLLIGSSQSSHSENKDRPQLLEALIKKGADPNWSDRRGTPVQIAANNLHPNARANEAQKQMIKTLTSQEC